MTWIALALLSAVGKAANQVVTKRAAQSYGTLALAAGGHVGLVAVLLPVVLLLGAASVPRDPAFHVAAWIAIVLNVGATLLLVHAIGVSDLSYSLPFLSLTPLLTVGTAWLIRAERLTAIGILGIAVTVAGAFAVGARSWRDWTRLGGRRIFSDRGTRAVILVATLYSVSSVFDKTATLLAGPVPYVWYAALGRCVILVTIFGLMRGRGFRPTTALTPIIFFLALGATFALESIAQMSALEQGLVAYVLAVKRLSIVLTSIAGIAFFQEEKSAFRLAGAAAMVLGAAAIYWST